MRSGVVKCKATKGVSEYVKGSSSGEGGGG